jgi:aspartate dehydrogenase
MRAALIGVGSIGGYIFEGIRSGLAGPVEVVGLADVPGTERRLAELSDLAGCRYSTNALDLLGFGPDIVIEAASQAAARAYAVLLLEGGADLLLMSVGALADADFYEQVRRAAARAGRTVYLPSGAIGGLDVLRSARVDRLEDVMLITSKPPRALAGAPFFDQHPVDLVSIRERTVIFEGPAGEAVRLFPANVNVAAALSLAGLGPEQTRMQVVADPALDRNVHEVVARGSFGELRLRLSNVPSPANPKTSFLACLSPLATLRRLSDPIQIG